MSHPRPVGNVTSAQLQCADARRRCNGVAYASRSTRVALHTSCRRRCVYTPRRCTPPFWLVCNVCLRCGQSRWVLRRFGGFLQGEIRSIWSGGVLGRAAASTNSPSPPCLGRVIRVPRPMCTADRALPHCVRPQSPRVPATGASGTRRRPRVAQPCRTGALRCLRP